MYKNWDLEWEWETENLFLIIVANLLDAVTVNIGNT